MIDTDKYEDYTMWIYTEKLDGYFNGEWEDGQTEGQVIKEFNELVADALAQDEHDRLMRAELRKHTNYILIDEVYTSQNEECIIEWVRGEEE